MEHLGIRTRPKDVASQDQLGGGSDPGQRSYSPGSFTVATGNYTIMSRRLQLTGTQQATLSGTARLRIT